MTTFDEWFNGLSGTNTQLRTGDENAARVGFEAGAAERDALSAENARLKRAFSATEDARVLAIGGERFAKQQLATAKSELSEARRSYVEAARQRNSAEQDSDAGWAHASKRSGENHALRWRLARWIRGAPLAHRTSCLCEWCEERRAFLASPGLVGPGAGTVGPGHYCKIPRCVGPCNVVADHYPSACCCNAHGAAGGAVPGPQWEAPWPLRRLTPEELSAIPRLSQEAIDEAIAHGERDRAIATGAVPAPRQEGVEPGRCVFCGADYQECMQRACPRASDGLHACGTGAPKVREEVAAAPNDNSVVAVLERPLSDTKATGDRAAGESLSSAKSPPPRRDSTKPGPWPPCNVCQHKGHPGRICFEWVKGVGSVDDVGPSVACGCLAFVRSAPEPTPTQSPEGLTVERCRQIAQHGMRAVCPRWADGVHLFDSRPVDAKRCACGHTVERLSPLPSSQPSAATTEGGSK